MITFATRLRALVRQLVDLVTRLSCRHTYLRRAASGRLWLECAECRHQTSGLHLSTAAEARARRDLDAIIGVTEWRAPRGHVSFEQRAR